eukprot:434911-Alexandrium_andersonii.AAC.1
MANKFLTEMVKAKEREALQRFIPREFRYAEVRALLTKDADDGKVGDIAELLSKEALMSCVDTEAEDGGRDALEKAQ